MQEQNEYYDSYELDEMAKNYHDYMELVEYHNYHPLVRAGNCEVEIHKRLRGETYKILRVVHPFFAYKQTFCPASESQVLTTLEIDRSSLIPLTFKNRGKFRSNYARVVRQKQIRYSTYIDENYVSKLDKNNTVPCAVMNSTVVYKTGDHVFPEKSSPFCYSNEVRAGGIHFFLTEQEALGYKL